MKNLRCRCSSDIFVIMKIALAAVLAVLFLAAPCAGLDDIKVWPVFYQNTDPETRTARTEFLWPFYVRETTPNYAANQFLSWPQTFPPDYPHQFYLLWPLGGLRTGAGHDAWLFPFLWSGSEPRANDHYLALFPAFYYGEEGDATTLNLALLQHNRWSPNGSRHYLFPLFWSTRDITGSRSERGFGFLPLIWISRSDDHGGPYQCRSRSGGVLLLNWWCRESSTNRADGRLQVSAKASENLFPVYHRSRSFWTYDAGGGTTNARDAFWLIPYWQSHETRSNRADTVRKARHRFFPLYWDWTDTTDNRTDTGRTLLPLWWHSATLSGEATIESADFLVPVGAHFYKKDEYETHNLLGPVFNRTENTRSGTVRYDAFFPFFSMTRGEEEWGGHVFPLAGWNTAPGKHENLWYAFPLGWDCETQEPFDYRMNRPQLFALHELETRPAVSETDCRRGPRRTVAFYPFFWSRRQADEQHEGVLPLYWRNTFRYGRSLSLETVFPFLLGSHGTVYRDDVPVSSRQNYLLSMIAHGRGSDLRQWRFFPLFSYRRSGGSLDYSSFILPFSYESWRDTERSNQNYSSELSIPFAFLPLYRSETRQSEASGDSRTSWFFPFYKREKTSGPEADRSKLSILWPLWNGEWVDGETHVRGLGGAVNFYERDAGGFVEQRLLYRVFTRRTRSWFNEHELMPLYAQSAHEDGTSSWGFLGGLVGGGCDGARNYLRLLYLKIPTTAVQPVTAEARATAQLRHADLALNYLKHNRHDRAAIEFTLAGTARAEDAAFQSAAGEAYLKANPDALGKELRSSIPSSLDPIYGRSAGRRINAVRTNLRTLAVGRFEDALRLGADKAATLRMLAAALNELGRHSEALQRLEESDRVSPAFATAMLRMDTAEAIWQDLARSAKPDSQAAGTALAVLHSLLAEMKTRYPQSPSLALREASLIQRESDPHRPVSYPYHDAFSPVTLRCLDLYKQGANGTPGAEEQAWMKGPTARERDSGPPNTQCARLAIEIMNRQMSALVSDKKQAEAEALCAPILKMLPLTCLRCAVPDDSRSRSDYRNPVGTALQNLYHLYIDVREQPLDYIAAVEGLEPALCRHYQPALSNALESVRLEQQYIKTWHVTGEIGGEQVSRSYAGAFFNRYVDMDELLGRPDHCAVGAECVVTSPDERPAVLRVGFDQTLTVEWNGVVVFGPKSRRIAVRDEYRIPLTLKAGENRLRLTVADDTLAYGFFARLSSEAGEFMRDVTVTAGTAGDGN